MLIFAKALLITATDRAQPGVTDELITTSVVTFGQLRFDRRLGELSRRDGNAGWVPVTIGSRAAAVLGALLRAPGVIVSKDALMDEVWPSTTVEANNLTVQIAALRRALGEGNDSAPLIQTVAGRGYRFAGGINETKPLASANLPTEILPTEILPTETLPTETLPGAPERAPPLRRWIWALGAAAFACVLLALGIRQQVGFSHAAPPPRASLIVLPFQNLSGDPSQDFLAKSMTNDVFTRLSLLRLMPGTMRSASPAALKGVDLTPEAVGRRFNVRYMLGGSVRRVSTVLQVDSQLLSTETGAMIWTDHLDVPTSDPVAGQQAILRRIAFAARAQMIAAEDARSRRERPQNPDALDLVIRASALQGLLPSPERLGQARDLYERAVQLDPSMDVARIGLAGLLLDGEDGIPRGRKTVLERTRSLLVTIRASEPAWWGSMLANLHWLGWQYNRCPEMLTFGKAFIAAYPDFPQPYRWLGDCQTRMGLAEEALPTLEEAFNRDQGLPWLSHDDRNLQYAYLLLGRYDDSISWGMRALLDNPEDMDWERGRLEFRLAAAHALAGHLEEAKRHLANGMRLQPRTTLRQFEEGRQASPAYAVQLERVIEGLRLAGLRDHADEHAEFGVAAEDRIAQDPAGWTPTTVPGAKTIDTDALSAILAQEKPVVIDTMAFFAGRSIPGAVGLALVGVGGDVSDLAQDHLRPIARELSHGNLGAPVVALGWNSENFSGRNFALRLVALGYTNVYWYRGGREAWEARQLPEAELGATDW